MALEAVERMKLSRPRIIYPPPVGNNKKLKQPPHQKNH
ncbi:hypothetical protein CCACVL1_17976 [Corchorus capsularis]|uniref:Uncharacterized protein n=1 Tax=Corchorus capsularis TaxID=210143 RepID=A0A1R3HP65_COCAP|nr:hypothetical protein CCACVL1_17976 [Corchorus capsularis]